MWLDATRVKTAPFKKYEINNIVRHKVLSYLHDIMTVNCNKTDTVLKYYIYCLEELNTILINTMYDQIL